MSRIWAVARHMIAEGVRMKIALVFIGVLLIILPVMPFTVAGDGLTLKSRVQSFLAYSLTSVTFLLSILTVFLSCSALANEIRGKQIVMIVSKPIPRWQFFAGKWLGISLLNAGLLLGTGVAVWAFTRYLAGLDSAVPGDKAVLENEVLTARYGVKPEKPDLAPLIDERVRKLREEGRVEKLTPQGEKELRETIAEELRTSMSSLGPKRWKEYKFTRLLVDRESGGWVQIHMKPTTPTGVDDLPFRIYYQGGDRADASTLTRENTIEVIAGRVTQVPIPVSAVNKEGDLYVRIANMDPKNTIAFEAEEDLQVLYDLGAFHWNLMRALIMIWCRLAFLAALGLLASSFVSFPVACLISFLTLLMAATAGFVQEAFDWTVRWKQPMDVWLAVWVARTGWAALVAGAILLCVDLPRARLIAFLVMISSIFIWVFAWWMVRENAEYTAARSLPFPILSQLIFPTVASDLMLLIPDFSKYDPVGNIVGGQVVPLMWVLKALTSLVLFGGLICGILGSTIFTKRELARGAA